MRTPIEIENAIKKLQQSKKERPEFDLFWPIHQGIDAKIDVLKNNLSEQDVINKYKDYRKLKYVTNEALSAVRYLNQKNGYEEIN